MNIKDINPLVYGVSYFKYNKNQDDCPKLSFEKTQYCYRFIIVGEGSVNVSVAGKTENLQKGDILYLLPGEVYKLLPCNENFLLYSIYFNFTSVSPTFKNFNSCVFISDFAIEEKLSVLHFENAEVLNNSGIFKNANLTTLKELIYSEDSEVYPLYARAEVLTIIANILNSAKVNKSQNKVAKNIVDFIKIHPESELSTNLLADRFSYHKNHINKLVKEETGKSLIEFIRYVKIEYAKTLLFETEYSLTEISERLGYYDYSHFFKAFVKETGIAPLEYKKLKCKGK